MAGTNLYSRIIEEIFLGRYHTGDTEVAFEREDIIRCAQRLTVPLPKNLGDLIYSFRYRTDLPESIRTRAGRGKTWLIKAAGKGRYKFVLASDKPIKPNDNLATTKVPDATPGIVAKYALNDEQALLAKIRYNRLIDTFLGITCYSLQNHLRTSVPDLGQVETDELYVGLDKRGAHYVVPVQAKSCNDRLSAIQVE